MAVDWRVVSFVLFTFCLYLFLSPSSSGSPPLHDNVREESWRYPERASDTDVDTIYSQCGSLIPPKAEWWPHQRPAQQLPLVPLVQRRHLGCLAELYELRTGAELGVQQGYFANETLSQWPSCEKYILVDLWKHQATYDDGSNVEDSVQEARFEETKSNLKQYSHITEFLRMYTSEAAKLVPDNSLDYIYVDARHDYCGVREDLRTWWPKLRMGGIFAGHDYLSGAEALKLGHTWRQCMDGSEGSGSVKGAVNEFAFANNLQVLSTRDRFPSWYLQKHLPYA